MKKKKKTEEERKAVFEDKFVRQFGAVPKVIGEVVGVVIGGLILYYVLPILPFVTDKYGLWLPIGFNAMVWAAIFKSISYMLRFRLVVRTARIAEHGISMYSTNMLMRIFPFDFGRVGAESLNTILDWGLLIVIYILGIAIIVELVKLITFWPLKEGKGWCGED